MTFVLFESSTLMICSCYIDFLVLPLLYFDDYHRTRRANFHCSCFYDYRATQSAEWEWQYPD
jgi:hypothetical protein